VPLTVAAAAAAAVKHACGVSDDVTRTRGTPGARLWNAENVVELHSINVDVRGPPNARRFALVSLSD